MEGGADEKVTGRSAVTVGGQFDLEALKRGGRGPEEDSARTRRDSEKKREREGQEDVGRERAQGEEQEEGQEEGGRRENSESERDRDSRGLRVGTRWAEHWHATRRLNRVSESVRVHAVLRAQPPPHRPSSAEGGHAPARRSIIPADDSDDPETFQWSQPRVASAPPPGPPSGGTRAATPPAGEPSPPPQTRA